MTIHAQMTRTEGMRSRYQFYIRNIYFQYPEVYSFVKRDAYKYKRTEIHTKNDPSSKPKAFFESKSGKVVEEVDLSDFTR